MSKHHSPRKRGDKRFTPHTHGSKVATDDPTTPQTRGLAEEVGRPCNRAPAPSKQGVNTPEPNEPKLEGVE